MDNPSVQASLTGTELSEQAPAVEPLLEPLSGKQFSYTSAITNDNARPDICAQGLWGSGSQRAFFM